jgi:RHS repeat-associated protein
VSDGNGNTASYTYLANSPLVRQIVFANSGATRMTTTKQYDYLNRLTGISSVGGTSSMSPVSTFNYRYNPANQRTQTTNIDNSFWAYQYDNLGQVISGKKYWSDGTPVAGQQFTYNFDDIGNRKSAASGGDATGSNLRSANYTANNLNQYTARDVPGYATVLGTANPNATVTVNLQRAVRQGGYFWDELSENNGSSSLYLSLTNLAVLNNGTNANIIATNVGNIFLPLTPETFGYDADGNLTNDGRWAYTWDAENRLVQMTVNTNVGPLYQLNFAYDAQGRRIQKLVVSNSVALYTNRFLYDGWNLVAILNPQSTILESFMWGSDLSGSMQGAGGVGGLLEVSYHGSLTTNCFPAFDGNGNVAALINAANGTMLASYEYGPFGEVIRATGPMAKANPFRFSTKYQDDETDLLYYGYRYYSAGTGRWLSRDPIEERGFWLSGHFNQHSSKSTLLDYAVSENNPLIYFDATGLCCPGCKKNCKASTYLTAGGYNPSNYKIAGAADSAYGGIEKIEEILEMAATIEATDGASLADALADAISSILGSAAVQAGGATVAGLESLIAPGDTSTGYSEFTKLSWEECKSGLLWNSWNDKDTGWQPVLGADDEVGNAFPLLADALKAAAESAKKQKDECKKAECK